MQVPPFIHESADVEPGAEVGRGTRIWARTHIRNGAKIGADCIVGEAVFIDEGVHVGDNCKIQNQALLYHGAFLEDGVFIGPGVCITNDRHPRAINSDGTLKTPDDWKVTPVHIRRGAALGAGTVVVAGCDIGEFAMTAAGSVIAKPVPSFALMAGVPARRIGWVCRCGERIGDELRCSACGSRYELHGDGLTLV